jgi:hypothetical protein
VERDARDHAAVGKAETLELLRTTGPEVGRLLRGLDDEQVDRVAMVFDGTEMTVAQVVEFALVGHFEQHLESIRATLGRLRPTRAVAVVDPRHGVGDSRRVEAEAVRTCADSCRHARTPVRAGAPRPGRANRPATSAAAIRPSNGPPGGSARPV